MKKGFSLLEVLISLLIVSLVMHLLLTSVRHYQLIYSQHHHSRDIEWQQFLILLEQELGNYHHIHADRNQLRLTTRKDQQQMVIKCQNQQIYITPGYHPLLFDVQEWAIQSTEDVLFIELRFTNNEYYAGHVKINERLP